MTAKDKAVVYVDVDDEITTVIDKMRSADGRIVALVLPKRAALLQSIVNMKLLKRSADTSKKRLVLITTEAGLLPLAGAAGLHVAKTLQSAPSIPIIPHMEGDDEVVNEDSVLDAGPGDALDLDSVAHQPIGDWAAAAPLAAAEPETIELDNAEAPVLAAAAPIKAAKAPKIKKDNKLKVPNFSRFRLLIALGVIGLVLLGVLLYLALVVLPKATVTITTNSSDVKTAATVTLDPNVAAVSADMSTIPASTQQKQQSASQQVASTGSQNKGQTASGNVNISNCTKNNTDVEIPAGTGLSANGQTYVTQGPVSLVTSGYRPIKGTCNGSTATVGVVAQKPGAGYNVGSGTNMTVAAPSDGSYSPSEVPAVTNGSISGGTDNIVKIVAQADIDSAKQKLNTSDTTSIKQGLQQALQQNGYTPIVSSFNGGTPTITQSANVGDTADSVTVTQAATYTMYGVKLSDVKQVITSNVDKQIDPSKVAILNDGSGGATYKVVNTAPEQVVISATSTTGPHLVADTLKQQVEGKKSAAITDLIKQTPGVTNVTVKYSPFWVDTAPSKPSKITIIFQKQQ